MKESQMSEISEFIRRVVIEKEVGSRIRGDIAEFRRNYSEIHYCFEKAVDAYKYFKIR